MEKSDLDRAIEDFTRAIEISPIKDEAYFYRAIAWYKKGDIHQALNDARKAFYLNPMDKRFQRYMDFFKGKLNTPTI